jgi:hexosaminidase
MKRYQDTPAGELYFPTPVMLEEREGFFRLHATTTIAAEPPFEQLADLATQLLGCKRGGEDLLLKYADGMEAEEYRLAISPKQIVIYATTEDGAFYGLSALRRIALLTDGIVPALVAEDKPTYQWRGFMLDSCRHFFTVDFVKKLIDTASLFGLNRFHWHLTDDQGWRLPLAGWPNLEKVASRRVERQYYDGRTYGGIYTREEILEVQAYAHQRRMLVIPEIETPGHVSALLAAYPNLGCTGGPYEVQDRWGIFDEVLCAGNDEVLTFIEDAIGQIAELFTDPYLHIGGDECPQSEWERCPKCQKRMQEEGLTEERQLQSWLTSKISAMVHAVGKRPIGWDEVLDGTEKMGLPSDLIVQSWQGIRGGIEASRRGHQVIMSPNTQGCYLDYKHTDSPEEMGNLGVSTLTQVASFTPTPSEMDEKARQNILGGQGNLWTERILTSRQAEYMLFPRLMLLAQQLWNPRPVEENLMRRDLLTRFCELLDLHCYRGKEVV